MKRLPWPVGVVFGVLAGQGLALLGFTGWLVLQRRSGDPSNHEVFEGAVAYLGLSAVLVLLVASAVRSRRGWALAAALVVQLIALGVTFEMVRAGFWLGALPLGLAAIAAIGGALSPAARQAFGRVS